MPRARAGRGPDDEAGFSLIELIIAMSIISVVMISLSYSVAQSMKVYSYSEQRQTAAALAGQVLEEVRALPFAVVAAGMSTSDIAAVQSSSAPDSDISGSSAPYTFEPNGEQIVSGSTSSNPPAPLYPYRTGPQVVNGTSYVTATYVTQPTSLTCAGCYRATVVVSWYATQESSSGADQVSLETLLSSPDTGCISSNTHPFAAPCQPFFYGEASSGAGSISITSATAGEAALSDLLGGGVDLEDAQLNLFEDDATLQSEQVSEVSGDAQTSQVSLQTVGNDLLSGGGISGSADADNDPAIDTNMAGPASLTQSGTLNFAQSTSGGNSLTVAASNDDTASLVSTTAANASTTCDDLSSPAVVQTTGQACGSESVTQNGTGSGLTEIANATLSATLGLTSPGLGSVDLASVAPVTGYTPTRAFVAYYPSGAGQPGDCALSSGDGCVHAGGSENIGTILLGGAPTLLSPLTGWAGYLVKVANYSASVAAESGGGAASPTATCSYTLSYWTGSGYATTSCGSLGTRITAQYSPLASLVGGSLVSLNITGTFQTGAATTSTGSGTETAQVTPPLTGNITYTISVGSVQIVDVNIAVNLGTLLAQTDYQAAPNAN